MSVAVRKGTGVTDGREGLEAESRCSVRTASALNYQAVSAALKLRLVKHLNTVRIK